MSNDSYWLFIILASLIALILPTPAGEVVYTLIAIPIAWLAGVATQETSVRDGTSQVRPRNQPMWRDR